MWDRNKKRLWPLFFVAFLLKSGHTYKICLGLSKKAMGKDIYLQK